MITAANGIAISVEHLSRVERMDAALWCLSVYPITDVDFWDWAVAVAASLHLRKKEML